MRWTCWTNSTLKGCRIGRGFADAGYGISVEFRRGLGERAVMYVVGIAGNEAMLTEQPTWSVKPEPRGRPPKR